MADPHNHTHQRRHTPRRRAWATLAIGALLATLLTIAAAPAAVAVPRMADAQATWKACLGPATGDAGFTDVADTNTHATNINCLAYYGITTGRTADTFSPDSNVTRGQMALFLTRAAKAADIDLGDVMDQGFTDLDGRAEERVHAINRLAAKNIMPGRTADTFDPDAHVTRAEMAQHLFQFLYLAVDEVIIDRIPDSIEENMDGVGHIELNDDDGDGRGEPVDDYFGDVRQSKPRHIDDIVGAIYELGVTNGTNTQVGANGTFEPDAHVTRAQMASFIMRTLGHTNLRPAGITAQHTTDTTQVSVRTDDFTPVEDARVEVFSSNYPDDAFDSDGECSTRWVIDAFAPSFDTCSIDVGDTLTDAHGNAEFPVGSGLGNQLTIQCTGTKPGGSESEYMNAYTLMTGSRTDNADYTAWAWTGDLDADVDEDTQLFEVEDANAKTSRREATHAVLKGGNPDVVKMGETLRYTIQLATESMGMYSAAGPSSGENYAFDVTVEKITETTGDGDDPEFGVISASDTAEFNRSLARLVQLRTTRHTPDSSGLITIDITNPDPRRFGPTEASRNNADVRVELSVRPAPGNSLTVVNRAGMDPTPDDNIVTAPWEVFSDNPAIAHKLSSMAGAEWRLLGSGSNRNSVNIAVTDQYGDAYRNTAYSVKIDPGSTEDDGDTTDRNEGVATGVVNNSGKSQLSYNKGSADGHEGATGEDVAVSGELPQVDENDQPATALYPLTGTVTVYWANRGEKNDDDNQYVLLGDARANELIIDVSDNPGDATAASERQPMAYSFGDDDKFVVEGEVVTMAQFEEIISSPQIVIKGAMLSWDDYDRNRRSDEATWRLSGLLCKPATGSSD